MKLSKERVSTISDICRETAVVVFGGVVIGNLLSKDANSLLTICGFAVYLILAFLAIYFKKKG